MNSILLRKTFRDLRASFSQTIALIVIVALGVCSFIGLIGSYRDLDSSYSRTYNELDFADVSFSVASMPQNRLSKIAALSGVKSATGRLIFDAGMEQPGQKSGSDSKQIRSRLIGLPDNHQPAVNKLSILRGEYLNPGGGKETMVESHFADVYHLKQGDTLRPIINGKKQDFKIVGVAASPEYLIVSASRQDIIPSAATFGVLFVPLPELQKLTGAGKALNNINVLFKPGANEKKTIADIKKLLKPYSLLGTVLRKDQPSNEALQLDVDGFKEIAYIMPTLILFVALVSIYMLLSRVVLTQRSQIGVAKALGYPNSPIVSHYMFSAVVIGVLGSVLGWLGGIPLANLITSSYASELGIPLVQTHIYPDIIAISTLMSLIVAALAGLGPALGAAKIAPAVAMHPDVATKPSRHRFSWLDRLMRLPLWVRLSMRSVFRVRRRAISTGLGIIFSLALVVVGWGMINSMNDMIRQNFDVVERWDETVTFNSPVASSSVLKKINDIKGVTAAEPILQLPATVSAHGETSDILVTGLSPSQKMHIIQLPPGVTPNRALANGKLVINKGVAGKLKVKVGSRIKVKTPLGTKHLTVGGITSELMSAVSYMSIDSVKKWAKTDGTLFNAVYVKEAPSRADSVQVKLYHLPDVSGVQSRSAAKGAWVSLSTLYFSLLGFIFLFAIAMAFALMFNAVTVNTVERLREYATMRSMGAGMIKISLFMFLEDSLLWLIALIPGLALGWWATTQIGKSFNSDLFYFQVVIFNSTYVYTALGILLTLFLATLPAIRRVKKLNLADETRVMS